MVVQVPWRIWLTDRLEIIEMKKRRSLTACLIPVVPEGGLGEETVKARKR
ncbi:MAG: hypothetical protein ISS52_01885 [Dehalococcoidia bacterium]|nr:hypothetical protein [Dehalococcoidia bacterium]